MVRFLPASPRTVAPADLGTPRNGIVTVKPSPVSGLLVIRPSYGGYPSSVFTIRTAAAPACWPKIAFAARAHVPRSTTASWFLPASIPAAVNASAVQPSASLSAVAGSSATTTTLKLPLGRSAPLALMALTVVSPDFSDAPGNWPMLSTAATEMTPWPTDGEPTM